VDVGARREKLMEKTEDHVGKLETQLKQWGARLDELVAKADRAGTAARIDNRKRIDDLKAKVHAAQAKLDEVKTAGSEKWETLKTGVESAWSELELAFKKLKN
jgi:peptidoglycan hydrolase CwlO-like protein